MPVKQRGSRRSVIWAALAGALLVAMILNTKFLTPEEVAAAQPERFDPKQTAADLYTKAQAELPDRAQPLVDVVTGIQTDPAAAAEEFEAVSPSEGVYAFPVTTSGTVEEATAASLRLKVPGVSGETPILIPLTTAVNGAALRDAMGFKFADAPGQTEYQFVGDELKKLIQADLKAAVADPAASQGKRVKVVGVVSVQGSAPVPEAKPMNVQPLSLEVS